MLAINNLLAKMCGEKDTHDRHDWYDESGDHWHCFGGPFIETQLQIIKHRSGEEENEDP